jgi:DNA-binding beta-propeller fold protein YncE
MKPGRIFASTLLYCAFALPSFSKDWLFVTTNWAEAGNEQVLLIDPESGQRRTLWNGGGMLDAVVSPDARRLYVTYVSDKGDQLAVVETATGAVLHTAETPQLIRWIGANTPGLAISSDGRWLYLLKTNYSVGSYEFSMLTFDTRESRFVSEEQPISNCRGAHPQSVPGAGKVLVLCGGSESQASDGSLVLRLPDFQNFVLGRGGDGYLLYTAGLNGRIQAADVNTHEIVQISKDSPLRHRRFMPSSGTISPDGRLWYLPIKIPDNGEQEIEQILVFDTQVMRMTNVITPVGPFWGLALSSDGQRLYASQPYLKNIMVSDTGTRRTVRTLAVGAKPSILFAVKAP